MLEPLFTKQRIKTRDIVGGVNMLAGLVVMVGQGLTDFRGPIAQGVLWGVLSAVLFALRNLFQKYHFNDVTSDSLMFHQVVAVKLMLAIFVDYPQVYSLAAADLFNLVLLGTLGTAGAHTLLVFSLKQLPAKSVALDSCLQPVIGALLAWYVIREVPGVLVMIGGGMALSVAIYESMQQRRLV